PAPGFMDGVRQRADATGAVLIVDEVSAGFRLTTGGAHLTLDLAPDIAVFSKAMGNGYPIAAVIGIPSVMAAAERSFISSTMWTERIGPVAALATIRKFQKMSAAHHLIAIGREIQDGWRAIAARRGVPIEVGGIPPLGHFSFTHADAQALKALFITRMLDHGFLASLSFYAMLAHTRIHVRAYLDAADAVFAELADAIHTGDVAARVCGKPAIAGFRRLT
ncbi:aminotransferase class III-fold pyridoxal phosphate-dependent enzyme, partial [Candidatus Uhrbacteria bacterium]|nr:aminotransferase class III-fold pyridoxal phosphate-dependent enzyme [Candidatus Uhrbacteria bacterium]